MGEIGSRTKMLLVKSKTRGGKHPPPPPPVLIALTNTAFWLLIQHFGLRGRQEHHDIKMEDFCFAKDNRTVLNLLLSVKVLPKRQDKD